MSLGTDTSFTVWVTSALFSLVTAVQEPLGHEVIASESKGERRDLEAELTSRQPGTPGRSSSGVFVKARIEF